MRLTEMFRVPVERRSLARAYRSSLERLPKQPFDENLIVVSRRPTTRSIPSARRLALVQTLDFFYTHRRRPL